MRLQSIRRADVAFIDTFCLLRLYFESRCRFVYSVLNTNIFKPFYRILFQSKDPALGNGVSQIYGHMAIGPYATNMGKWGIPGKSYKNVAQQC